MQKGRRKQQIKAKIMGVDKNTGQVCISHVPVWCDYRVAQDLTYRVIRSRFAITKNGSGGALRLMLRGHGRDGPRD